MLKRCRGSRSAAVADVPTEVPKGSGGFVRRAVRRLTVIGAIGGAVIVALRKLQGGKGPD